MPSRGPRSHGDSHGPGPLGRDREPDASLAAAPVDRLDNGSLGRLAIGLQGAAGNRATAVVARRAVQRQGGAMELPPNPYTIETPGGGTRPELAANPYVGEDEPVTLANARFTGLPRLARIAAGQGALSSADNGPAVSAVQQALIAIGFEMIRHGQDGRFGDETREAINLFRSRRGMPAGDLSARALGELDQTAPAPGATEEHYFDYERLFEDGYLDVTIGIGYDEGGSHTQKLQTAQDWLAGHGFERAEAEPGQPELHRLRRDVTYPNRTGGRTTREVIVRVSLISPGSGAAAQFGRGLADSEIAVYTGHARRGIGPDFDEDKSPAENFIIGVGSALHAAGRAVEPSRIEQNHYVIDRVNDLEQMTARGEFDRERYRIWMFSACSSVAYFDELRNGILPASIDRSNLDLLGTRNAMPSAASLPSTLTLIDGILAARTVEQITAAMTAAGEEAIRAIPDATITPSERRELLHLMPEAWTHEGLGDNPVAPRP
jgi:peptidoglycan hydrolase-like protein with peptidoglycan-binding domain